MSEQAQGCLPFTNSVVIVPEDRFVAVERFGAFQQIIGPGLSFVGVDLCGVCVSLRSVSCRIDQQMLRVKTKTKDDVFVCVRVAVQHSIIADEVDKAIYRLADTKKQMEAFVSDVIRSRVPKLTLDVAFENHAELGVACEEMLTANMAVFGLQVHKALVVEIVVDQEVSRAMNEVNKQRRLRDAAALAADAAKTRVVCAAEARADAALLAGQGTARRRAAIVQGLREAVWPRAPEQNGAETAEEFSSDAVSELLLMTQYFETLRTIAANPSASVVFTPGEATSSLANGARQARADSGGGVLGLLNGNSVGSSASPPVKSVVSKRKSVAKKRVAPSASSSSTRAIAPTDLRLDLSESTLNASVEDNAGEASGSSPALPSGRKSTRKSRRSHAADGAASSVARSRQSKALRSPTRDAGQPGTGEGEEQVLNPAPPQLDMPDMSQEAVPFLHGEEMGLE